MNISGFILTRAAIFRAIFNYNVHQNSLKNQGILQILSFLEKSLEKVLTKGVGFVIIIRHSKRGTLKKGSRAGAMNLEN